MKRALRITLVAAALALPIGCATTEGSVDVGVGFYGDYWNDSWYWNGCCVNPPDGVMGPPHPEHPIANPPDGGLRPTHPIATTPSTRPAQPTATPSPRPAMRSGGGGRGGGGRR